MLLTSSDTATLNKDTANWLAAFERNILGRMFERIKLNENWRNRNDKELFVLFGDLDILSFVRISQLNWIGHLNRMGKVKVQELRNRPGVVQRVPGSLGSQIP
jgi:hypothetical protein